MPYKELPDDFKQKYRSVWVDVPSHLFDAAKAHGMYNEYLDELEFADKMGFDGICVNEHHNNAYGMMPSPNIMAATLTRRTKNAAVIVLGNSIALYNPPIRVAEEFAMLDCISGGRLVAGFPVGTSMDTNFAYGQVPSTLREKYNEANDLIISAWTNPEVHHFNGKFNQLRYINPWPRPLQKPHPPVWVPGGGSIETWKWVAERNYLYAYLSYAGYIRGSRVMQGYWDTLDKMGIEPNPYRGGFLQLIAVSETDAKAEEEYWPAANYFYNRCLHIAPNFADAPGYRTINTVRAGLLSQVGGQVLPENITWKELIDQGYIVAGSPASVREQLQEVIKGLHVGHLMCLMQFGNLPREQVLKNTELFAREVKPHLEGMWSDYEDNWWINPLPAEQRSYPIVAEPQMGEAVRTT
jgi:alkanesulfonate monooxygenase SsuD/methylene tetrahydromethanopterin reductase-like flavin-dependent oxidoreductase (luciferase family)